MSKTVNEMSVDELLQGYLIPWGTKALLALVVFIVGRWLARLLTRALRKVLAKEDLDTMLIRFLGNVAYAGLLVVVVLAAHGLAPFPQAPGRFLGQNH